MITSSSNSVVKCGICRSDIKNGAKINAKNKSGSTPLDLAESFKMKEKAELLRKYGAK